MELRPHQVRAARELSALYETVTPTPRVLVLACTGAGKTALAGFVATQGAKRDKTFMWVANRSEIINQTWNTLLSFGFTPEDLSVIKGKDPRYRASAKVHIGSVQTLMRRESLPRVDYLILDECHHYQQANTWSTLPTRFPGARVLGLSATPVAGRGTEPAFDRMIVMAQPSELIAADFLTAPRVFTVPEDKLPDLQNVSVERGDYDVGELEKAVNTTKLVGSIVEHWMELAFGRRTVAFCTSIAHADAVRDEFAKRGVAAESFHGELSADAREAVMDRLLAGETLVICTVAICLEGWDAPHVRVAIMARPTKSLIVWLQSSGRVMRYFHGEDSMILDHAGNAMRPGLGLPHEDREWDLEGPKLSEVRVKTCPECYAVIPQTTRICPSCSYDFTAKEESEKQLREVKELEGRLVEMKRAETQLHDERRAHWDDLCRQATRHGYKDGWVRAQFDKKYDEPAPFSWPKPLRPDHKADDAKRRAELEKLRAASYTNGMGPDWVAQKYETRFGEDMAKLLEREEQVMKKALTTPAVLPPPTPPEEPDLGVAWPVTMAQTERGESPGDKLLGDGPPAGSPDDPFSLEV